LSCNVKRSGGELVNSGLRALPSFFLHFLFFILTDLELINYSSKIRLLRVQEVFRSWKDFPVAEVELERLEKFRRQKESQHEVEQPLLPAALKMKEGRAGTPY
jgi:hypothetical protein